MTLELRKPVRRAIVLPRHGDYVVELCPEGVRYRKKRTRTWLLLPHGAALFRAAHLAAAAELEARRARRRGKGLTAAGRGK